jgi:hypothetical protein
MFIKDPKFKLKQKVKVQAREMYAYHYQGEIGIIQEITYSILESRWTYTVLFTNDYTQSYQFDANELIVI